MTGRTVNDKFRMMSFRISDDSGFVPVLSYDQMLFPIFEETAEVCLNSFRNIPRKKETMSRSEITDRDFDLIFFPRKNLVDEIIFSPVFIIDEDL